MDHSRKKAENKKIQDYCQTGSLLSKERMEILVRKNDRVVMVAEGRNAASQLESGEHF